MDGKSLRKPRIYCDITKYVYKAFEESLRKRDLIALSQAESLAEWHSDRAEPHFENWLNFLMAIYGYDATVHAGIKFYFKESYYVHVTGNVAKLKQFLKHQPLFVRALDIQKELSLSENELESYLCFVGDLESKVVKGVHYYRMHMKDLADSLVVVYRILYEHGSPLHGQDIRERAIKGGWLGVMVNMSPMLVKSEKIIPIGKSGVWVLKEWCFSTATVQVLISKVLKDAGVPLESTEIANRVSLSRPIDNTSIRSFLGLYKKLFVKYADGKFGMRQWRLQLPVAASRPYGRLVPLQKDKVVAETVGILKGCKEPVLLKDLMSLLLKNGYTVPSIYGALNGRKDLFVKGALAGSKGRSISLR